MYSRCVYNYVAACATSIGMDLTATFLDFDAFMSQKWIDTVTADTYNYIHSYTLNKYNNQPVYLKAVQFSVPSLHITYIP